MQPEYLASYKTAYQVPILIQPEGWMQHRKSLDLESNKNGVFQSSSNPKAGCNIMGALNVVLCRVPILIQPEGWMQRDRYYFCPVFAVPILIQPEGWMQHKYYLRFCDHAGSNPHPTRRLDATKDSSNFVFLLTSGSNPHPTRRLDAT